MNPQASPATPPEPHLAAAKALDETVHSQLAQATMGLSPISLALAYADWALHLAASPGRQTLLAQRAWTLGLQVLGQAAQADARPPSTPEADPRFADPGWRQWPFNVLKHSFQAQNDWWTDAAQVNGMAKHSAHVMAFFTRQWMDALSPSNWGPTNPEVLRAAEESQGQSWARGYQAFVQDWMEAQHGRQHADDRPLQALPFEVGKDVALTPGKVVFRNRLIELIQYTPTTAQVFPEPLLIVPSCIMKYYILDLSPHNSMVRYLVSQGHTVFILSWRNPEASDRDLGMQDYLQMGVMEALAGVKACTGAPRVHALGYCLGGTFLSIVAALLGRHAAARAAAEGAAPQRRREDTARLDALPELATVTLLAAMTDFSEPGEMGVFIDDDQLQSLREDMARRGYLTGKQMAGSFQFLNSRDLVWSRNTRRYLMGQDEVGNDMMSWNADLTRLPERMHNEYLSSLFLNNALATGRYRVGNLGAVALSDIQVPLLVVGTARDHVSPWRSVYKIHLLTDTATTFILAAGGHNAGIVSEPGHPRRSYQIDHLDAGHAWVDPEDWLAQAPTHEGSWWPAMHAFLSQHSGQPVPAAPINPTRVLCDAPGDYVMVRYAD